MRSHLRPNYAVLILDEIQRRNFTDRPDAPICASSRKIDQIRASIGKLGFLSQHPFNALVPAADAGVDTVAEVFVRINGQGGKLNQAEFGDSKGRYRERSWVLNGKLSLESVRVRVPSTIAVPINYLDEFTSASIA